MEAGSDHSQPGFHRERAILVGVSLPRQPKEEVEEHLEELARLTRTAGGVVVGTLLQERSVLDPAHLIGRGKAADLAAMARAEKADLIIFDQDLSPAQARNLEKLIEVRVIDRSALILDIFARGARSREARTQVELAQLRYLLPRLTRRWTHLSRQVGGIGVRGVGETQLEIDRRIVRKKISQLSSALRTIEKSRQVRRKGRSRAYQAALIGYTNSGKSTLLNRLTRAAAKVEDRLFATLDPMTRRYRTRQGKDIVLTDTVGFIRKLPHQLIASFRSTLQEALEADLLVEIIDLGHPNYEVQREVTERVLGDLGALDKPRITVYNKIDSVADPTILDRARQQDPEGIFVSALIGTHLEELRERIEAAAWEVLMEDWVSVPIGSTRLISRIHSLAEVIDTTSRNGYMRIRIRTSRVNVERIRGIIGKEGG
ncbi:MAG: GTPase HflX [Acidobacteria bacterium]|nr:GTPase HflX [Acidobacteriota bacterium]